MSPKLYSKSVQTHSIMAILPQIHMSFVILQIHMTQMVVLFSIIPTHKLKSGPQSKQTFKNCMLTTLITDMQSQMATDHQMTLDSRPFRTKEASFRMTSCRVKAYSKCQAIKNRLKINKKRKSSMLLSSSRQLIYKILSHLSNKSVVKLNR